MGSRIPGAAGGGTGGSPADVKRSAAGLPGGALSSAAANDAVANDSGLHGKVDLQAARL